MKPEACPAPADGNSATDIEQEGYLSKWDEESAVRTKPYLYTCAPAVNDNSTPSNWFFPSALPYLHHPLLAELTQNQVHELLARNLITFLEYTTLLEHRIVNKSVQFVAHDCLPVTIPHGMRMDALRIYADEGYHAIMSADVAHQVSGIFKINYGTRKFNRIARLEAMAEKFRFPALGWFLIGFVSETAITKQFTTMGKASLVPGVYNMLMDHLSDEWKHSHYFVSMFSYLWPRLTKTQRNWPTAYHYSRMFPS